MKPPMPESWPERIERLQANGQSFRKQQKKNKEIQEWREANIQAPLVLKNFLSAMEASAWSGRRRVSTPYFENQKICLEIQRQLVNVYGFSAQQCDVHKSSRSCKYSLIFTFNEVEKCLKEPTFSQV